MPVSKILKWETVRDLFLKENLERKSARQMKLILRYFSIIFHREELECLCLPSVQIKKISERQKKQV